MASPTAPTRAELAALAAQWTQGGAPPDLDQRAWSRMLWLACDEGDAALMRAVAPFLTDLSFSTPLGDTRLAYDPFSDKRVEIEERYTRPPLAEALALCANLRSFSVEFTRYVAPHPPVLYMHLDKVYLAKDPVPLSKPPEPQYASVVATSYKSCLPHPDPALRKDPTGDWIPGYWETQLGTDSIGTFFTALSRLPQLEKLTFAGGAAAYGNTCDLFKNLRSFKHLKHLVLRDNGMVKFDVWVCSRELHRVGPEFTLQAMTGCVVDIEEKGIGDYDLSCRMDASATAVPVAALPASQPPLAGRWRIFIDVETKHHYKPPHKLYPHVYATTWDSRSGSGVREIVHVHG